MSTRAFLRILIVGDTGVGKSSLITSFIHSNFIEDLPHLVPKVLIPSEHSIEHCRTEIIDSSCKLENRAQLELEIKKASVIILVYNVVDVDSFDRISSFWIPLFRKLGIYIPVIICGNKSDLRDQDVSNENLEEILSPIMNEFKEIEVGIECSAKLSLNISECFYFAQKAVLYPSNTLYDTKSHQLKPDCRIALDRIFTLIDSDKDGYLTDDDLNAFQEKCFNNPLQKAELNGIKEAVVAQNTKYLVNDLLTLDGFLYLNKMFIQRGRVETTWIILRKFGYGDDLQLRNEFLFPQMTFGDYNELSPKAISFLTELFIQHDKDKDGALNEVELKNLFKVAPTLPFTNTVTLQQFLAEFGMMTLLYPLKTLEYLGYLGFDAVGPTTNLYESESKITLQKSMSNAQIVDHQIFGQYDYKSSYAKSYAPNGLKLINIKKGDQYKYRKQRSVFRALVLGACGSGKSYLLNKFINKLNKQYLPTDKTFEVVNSVEFKGSERYLVLQEFGSKYVTDLFLPENKDLLEKSDLVVLMYDSSDCNSFSFVSNLYVTYLQSYPCVFIANKADLDIVQQRTELQPDMFTKQYGLDKPLHISITENNLADVFYVLIAIALQP